VESEEREREGWKVRSERGMEREEREKNSEEIERQTDRLKGVNEKQIYGKEDRYIKIKRKRERTEREERPF